MGHKWYVYAPIKPRDAARRIEEAKRALAQALIDADISPDAILELGIPTIEMSASPPPTPDEVREGQAPGEAQRHDAELTRIGPALARLSTLAQKYVRDLLQYGPFADVDAAEMYEVSPARVAEVRAEVRRAVMG